MLLSGEICRLRALEPSDVDTLYAWENDSDVWGVSDTTLPFSRHTLARFIDEQRLDIYQTRQTRFVIESLCDGRAVGAVDLFEFDPHNLRVGIGILVYGAENRRKGYASEALRLIEEYAREILSIHTLWCNILLSNLPSMNLFRKAGFHTSGVKRDWVLTPDGWEDEAILQKILK